MRSTNLLQDLQFHDSAAYSQPLFIEEHARVLRFMLKPGQTIRAHEAPHSPFYIVILKGHGAFTDGQGQEQQLGPGSLLIFDVGESHSVRALDDELVFVGFLHSVEGMRAGRVGGSLRSAQN